MFTILSHCLMSAITLLSNVVQPLRNHSFDLSPRFRSARNIPKSIDKIHKPKFSFVNLHHAYFEHVIVTRRLNSHFHVRRTLFYAHKTQTILLQRYMSELKPSQFVRFEIVLYTLVGYLFFSLDGLSIIYSHSGRGVLGAGKTFWYPGGLAYLPLAAGHQGVGERAPYTLWWMLLSVLGRLLFPSSLFFRCLSGTLWTSELRDRFPVTSRLRIAFVLPSLGFSSVSEKVAWVLKVGLRNNTYELRSAMKYMNSSA